MEPAAPASVPSSNAVRASPFPVTPKARQLDFRPHGRSEVSTFERSCHRSGLRRSALRLLCPLLTSAPRSTLLTDRSVSDAGDTSRISRGKIDRLRRTPAGFTTPVLDDPGLRDNCSLVRPGRPRYPVLVHRAAALLHASFRPHLATTPLRFANPSPPSGWIEDFHLQAVDHARHNRHRGAEVQASASSATPPGMRVRTGRFNGLR